MYIVITTIKKYSKALAELIQTLPSTLKRIIIYSGEEEDSYSIDESGNINVCISQNLYDYGVFIGLYILLQNGIISEKDWLVVLHDTCKVGPNFQVSIEAIKNKFTDADIVWFCNTGQCNLCIMRNVISIGYNFFNGMKLNKQQAIDIEYSGIKTFQCKQVWLSYQVTYEEARDIYGEDVYGKRITVRFDNIDLLKYYR
jgi:hypothetical protein